MGLEERVSRLEQRLGQPDEDDLVIYVFHTEGADGPILPGQEPDMIIRHTADGRHITTYGPGWQGGPPQYGPHTSTKVYQGFDPNEV
jgi:hypothetical protein